MLKIASLAASFIASSAIAQNAQPAADMPEPDAPPVIEPLAQNWTIRIEPYVGYIGPSGDLRLPSSTTRGGEIKLDSLNLDSPRLLPIGRIQAHRGKWRFGFNGLGFDASDRGAVQTGPGQIGAVGFAAGDRLASDLSYQTFDILASYRVIEHISDTNDQGKARVNVGIDVIAGLRFHQADIEVRSLRPSPLTAGTPLLASANEVFAEPVVGARLDLNIFEQFGMEVESLVGGFGFGDRSSVSFSIDAGFVYRPTPPIGIKVGYRLLAFDLIDGDGADEFNWAGSVAGLYFGAQFSF